MGLSAAEILAIDAPAMLDDETVRWLGEQAREDEDEELATACGRALVGNVTSIAVVKLALESRVARAHREHRRRGLAPTVFDARSV